MKWFQNLRIRARLLISFGVCIVFSIILAVTGIVDIGTVNGNYVYLLEGPQERLEHLKGIQLEFMNMRYRAANYVMNSGDLYMINEVALPQYDVAYAAFQEQLEQYIEHNNKDNRRDANVIKQNNENAQKLKTLLNEYHRLALKTLEAARTGDAKASNEALLEGVPVSADINALLTTMITPAEEYREGLVESTETAANAAKLILSIVSVILVIFACVLALFIGNSMSRSIIQLGKAAKEMAGGNLHVRSHLSSNTKDEVGDLSRDLGTMADKLNELIDAINTMANEFVEGDIEARMDASRFEGAYKSVAEGTNNMFGSTVGDTLVFLNCITAFANGDFSADIPKMPGKKVVMNNTLNNVRDNLKSVIRNINTMVGDAALGKLSDRADVTQYKGEWADILKGLNRLMEAVATPIQEAQGVLAQVALGNFDSFVTGDYQGDFLLIKTSINNTVTNMDSYIDEISNVLRALSQDDFDQEINREYVGKFSNIKDALNSIIEKFNHVLSDIASAAEQVAAGARQISESSMTLAQGASEQASSVEELNAMILRINGSTTENAKSAKEAESLSSSSKSNAAKGDQDMNSMLASMEGIKDSSNSISKIIKVIDDIAFQTNLLALNAAVEAARAGIHGKGFAVVAEEVRSLAGRSQNAAKETSQLIEESISRVNEGTQIAGTTADALQTIVTDVTKVAGIITNIASASYEQATAIGQVTEGLAQITEVVQSNSATSEESASASQQLSGQAEMLQNLVRVFKLKRSFRDSRY